MTSLFQNRMIWTARRGLEEIEAMPYKSINPCDGKVLQTFEELTDEQLERALRTSAFCFETWRHMIFTERATVAVCRMMTNECK